MEGREGGKKDRDVDSSSFVSLAFSLVSLPHFPEKSFLSLFLDCSRHFALLPLLKGIEKLSQGGGGKGGGKKKEERGRLSDS